MSDKTTNPFGSIDFLEAQKTFLDAWSTMSQFMSPDKKQSTSSDINNAWSQAMEFWGKSTTGFLPDDVNHVLTNLVEQSRLFNLFGEQLSHFMKNYNQLDKSSKDWQQQLEKYFSEFKAMFVDQQNDASNIFKHMLGVWQQLPMDTIQRTFSSASLMPGDFLQEFKPDSLHAATEKYLSVPGIGYTRESQEAYLRGIRLWSDYQKALNEFNTSNSRVGVQALEQLQKKIFKLAEEREQITNLREIYDLWVDANEEAYAEFAYSEEYKQLYGELVNSLMKFKQYSQQIVDESLAAMNIPTRKGVDTIKRRQQDLRRELYATRQKLKNDHEQIKQLNKEIIKLKEDLKNLKTGTKSGIRQKKNIKDSTKKASKKKVAGKKRSATDSKEKTVKNTTRKKTTAKKRVSVKSKKSTSKSASKKVSADKDMLVIKI